MAKAKCQECHSALLNCQQATWPNLASKKQGLDFPKASVVTQMVKKLPAMRETQVGSQDWEDPLEGVRAAHSSILAWKIPWTEKPGGLQSMELQRIEHDWATDTFSSDFPRGGGVGKNIAIF